MVPILWLIDVALDIAFWLVLATVILSWLLAFNIVNGHNPTVRQIRFALQRLTEPLLGPIRRVLPDIGGIDISPIILLLAIEFVRVLAFTYLPPLLAG